MAGLTENGLEILRLPELNADLKSQADQIFSDLVPVGDTVDTSDVTTIGRLIGVVSPAYASLWEAVQQVYDSFNVNSATGIALDNMVALSGISRLPSSPTRATCLFTGNPNTLIGLNAKCSSVSTQRIFSLISSVSLTPTNSSGITISVQNLLDSTDYTVSYSVDNVNFTDITIDSGVGATIASILTDIKTAFDTTTGGAFTTTLVPVSSPTQLTINRADPFQTATFELTVNLKLDKCTNLGIVECDTIGPLPQAAGSIDTIAIPVSGWDSVSNPLPAVLGRFLETDQELRERFRNSKFVQAANIIEALLDALVNVAGIEDVVVYENDTDIVDPLGLPPHSFMPIVLGGLATEIGQAIWQNKPTGITSVGNTTVTVLDSQGLPHAISFRRPDEVPIYMEVDISDTGGMPGDVVAQIKQAVVAYADENYSIGDDVIYSRFYTPINSIAGFMVNSMTLGTSPSPVGTSNILINFDAVGILTPENIEVIIS